MSGNEFVTFRMLDANLNRCFEAIRTLEDIARFHDLPVLQATYKSLRHLLQGIVNGWDTSQLHLSRNAEGDVGKDQKTASELERPNGLVDIAGAAASRSQQSLRLIEEVAKTLYPESCTRIESIRYQIYDYNSSLQLCLVRDRNFLMQSKLYVLIDCQCDTDRFASRVRDISQAGVDLIQIRDKQKDARELIEYTRIALEAVDSAKTRIVVNDRADVAWATNCYGLHVGQTDLPVNTARKLLRTNSIVGLSTHDPSQVTEAIELGADYVGCGPTFPSQTKLFTTFSGTEFLRLAAVLLKEAAIPGFAIGGITLENLALVQDSGFERIAVSSAVWNSQDPAQAAERFHRRLSQ